MLRLTRHKSCPRPELPEGRAAPLVSLAVVSCVAVALSTTGTLKLGCFPLLQTSNPRHRSSAPRHATADLHLLAPPSRHCHVLTSHPLRSRLLSSVAVTSLLQLACAARAGSTPPATFPAAPFTLNTSLGVWPWRLAVLVMT
ncbi:hypothetical protein J6590_035408 [Homalodisca vitripennis]|nr:hypothetical protein J6590_035408 [Homalodisca vitripennis]